MLTDPSTRPRRYSVARPQRRSFHGAAERVERVGGDAGGLVSRRVDWAERLVEVGERRFAERQRFARIAGGGKTVARLQRTRPLC